MDPESQNYYNYGGAQRLESSDSVEQPNMQSQVSDPSNQPT
jgi:hypothetical protein